MRQMSGSGTTLLSFACFVKKSTWKKESKYEVVTTASFIPNPCPETTERHGNIPQTTMDQVNQTSTNASKMRLRYSAQKLLGAAAKALFIHTVNWSNQQFQHLHQSDHGQQAYGETIGRAMGSRLVLSSLTNSLVTRPASFKYLRLHHDLLLKT